MGALFTQLLNRKQAKMLITHRFAYCEHCGTRNEIFDDEVEAGEFDCFRCKETSTFPRIEYDEENTDDYFDYDIF